MKRRCQLTESFLARCFLAVVLLAATLVAYPQKAVGQQIQKPDKPTEKRPSIVDDLQQDSGYIEIGGGYEYQRQADEEVKNLHGFNGSVFYFPKTWVGIGGDFSVLSGSTKELSGTPSTDLELFKKKYSAVFGPTLRVHNIGSQEISGHALVGFVHDSGKTTLGTSSADFSANAFAMSLGAGVNVKITKHVAIKVFEFKYTATHFGGEWQNNFGVSTGLLFRFGGSKQPRHRRPKS